VLPHPMAEPMAAAANANRTAGLMAEWIVCRSARGLVVPFASIIAKCKTAPALQLVLAMLKI
jgi:hypothetical protein